MINRKNRSYRYSLVLFFLFGLLVVLWAPAETVWGDITKGPFLLRVYQNRAAVMWETDVDGQGKIVVSRADETVGEFVTEPVQVKYKPRQKDSKTAKERLAFIHKAWVEDLRAGVKYDYSVAGPVEKSGNYTFRTVPSETDEVRFVVYGDSRTNYRVHRRLIEQIMNLDVDFVVNCGDLVSNGDEYRLWGPEFFEPLKGLAQSVPVYTAKGNHEGRGGNYERLLIPAGEGNNYCFSYGPVHFCCADNYSTSLEEVKGLITGQAKPSQAEWKFVSYHIPTVNFGGHYSSWGGEEIMRALSGARVDFVIAGHSHLYERFLPVAPASGQQGGYVTYITSAGGGAELYQGEETVYHACTKKAHHFCLFEIKGEQLTMKAIDVEGNVIDRLAIRKNNGKLGSDYIGNSIEMKAVRLHQLLHKRGPKLLTSLPRKGEKFEVEYELSGQALDEKTEMSFRLRCEDANYETGDAQPVRVGKDHGPVRVKLWARPLVQPGKSGNSRSGWQLKPALWVECQYNLGDAKESVSHPIRIKGD